MGIGHLARSRSSIINDLIVNDGGTIRWFQKEYSDVALNEFIGQKIFVRQDYADPKKLLLHKLNFKVLQSGKKERLAGDYIAAISLPDEEVKKIVTSAPPRVRSLEPPRPKTVDLGEKPVKPNNINVKKFIRRSQFKEESYDGILQDIVRRVNYGQIKHVAEVNGSYHVWIFSGEQERIELDGDFKTVDVYHLYKAKSKLNKDLQVQKVDVPSNGWLSDHIALRSVELNSQDSDILYGIVQQWLNNMEHRYPMVDCRQCRGLFETDIDFGSNVVYVRITSKDFGTSISERVDIGKEDLGEVADKCAKMFVGELPVPFYFTQQLIWDIMYKLNVQRDEFWKAQSQAKVEESKTPIITLAWPNDYVNQIVQGDCVEHLKNIPDGCIDLVVTDPPYLMSYATNRRKDKDHRFCQEIENDNNPELIINVVEQIHRVMKENTAMYMFCNHMQVDFFKSVLEQKFSIRNMIIWEKNSWSSGDLDSAFGHMYEIIFLVNKGRRLFNGKRIGDVWHFDRVVGPKQVHQNQKPEGLIQQCIEKHSSVGDTVLDPFMGSGTTALAARTLGRNFVGFELDEGYYKIATDTLKTGEYKIRQQQDIPGQKQLF